MSDEPDLTMPRAMFEAWLWDRRDRVVGYSTSASDCPLARWMASRLPEFPSLTVCTVEVAVINDLKISRQRIPRWCRSFITQLDRRLGVGQPVRGERCLSVLARIDHDNDCI